MPHQLHIPETHRAAPAAHTGDPLCCTSCTYRRPTVLHQLHTPEAYCAITEAETHRANSSCTHKRPTVLTAAARAGYQLGRHQSFGGLFGLCQICGPLHLQERASKRTACTVRGKGGKRTYAQVHAHTDGMARGQPGSYPSIITQQQAHACALPAWWRHLRAEYIGQPCNTFSPGKASVPASAAAPQTADACVHAHVCGGW